jgi:hypothetical protein
MFSRVGFIVTNLRTDSRVVLLQQAKHGGAMDQRRQTGGEDDAAELPLLEHCILTGAGVRYGSTGKSKWKSRIISDPAHTVKPTTKALWRNLWPMIIDLWVASVLLLFIALRVIGSNTGKHLLKALGIP